MIEPQYFIIVRGILLDDWRKTIPSFQAISIIIL